MTITNMALRPVTEVAHVYSGKPGCCCGCRGKHTYASTYRQDSQDRRGYKINDDEVNDHTVRRIYKTVSRMLTEGVGERMVEDDFTSIETETRLYVIYWQDAEKAEHARVARAERAAKKASPVQQAIPFVRT